MDRLSLVRRRRLHGGVVDSLRDAGAAHLRRDRGGLPGPVAESAAGLAVVAACEPPHRLGRGRRTPRASQRVGRATTAAAAARPRRCLCDSQRTQCRALARPGPSLPQPAVVRHRRPDLRCRRRLLSLLPADVSNSRQLAVPAVGAHDVPGPWGALHQRRHPVAAGSTAGVRAGRQGPCVRSPGGDRAGPGRCLSPRRL